MENQLDTPARPPRAWPLFLIGFLLFVLGIGINVGLLFAEYLKTPWYVPILGTLGVLCMGASVVQRFGWLRCVGLVFFTIVCAAGWIMIVWFARTPAYTGPAQPGHKLVDHHKDQDGGPAFTAAFSDGTPFTAETLEDGKRTAIVFYRGHW